MAQVVEYMCSKCEALSSNSHSEKKKRILRLNRVLQNELVKSWIEEENYERGREKIDF
jgi:uncharacterized membrane protein